MDGRVPEDDVVAERGVSDAEVNLGVPYKKVSQ